MPIKRSPFSQPTTPTVPARDPNASSFSSGYNAGKTNSTYSSIADSLKPSAPASKGSVSTSSFQEEVDQLNKAVDTLKGRAALGSGNYAEIAKQIEQIAKGEKPKEKGAWAWVKKSIIGPTFDPIKEVWTGGEKENAVGFGDVVRRAEKSLESGFAYAAESIVNAPANILDVTGISKGQQPIKPTSLKEAWDRSKDPEWKVFSDPKYMTGWRKWDWVAQHVGQPVAEIALDPTTYVGIGTGQFTGRAGRMVLATKFAETEMVAKWGAELAKSGVSLDDIARYGEWVIPKHIREAENINSGIRFMGRTVKGTSGIGEEVAKVIAKPRAAIGDMMYRVSPELLSKTAVKSEKAAMELGIGRSTWARAGKTLSDYEVTKEIIGKTAQAHSKGAMITAYKKWDSQIRNVIKDIRANGWADEIQKLVEDPHLLSIETDQAKKAAAETFVKWQDDVRREVNSVYADYATKYGVDTAEIGNIDNYIHHRMTKDAREWINSKAGKKAAGKLWRTEDMSLTDLAGNVGATRYRKARVGGEFLGVKNLTQQQATIEGLNKIAEQVTGIKGFKWFETDIGSIADSYIYSMSKTRGREAFARRLQDFGADYIKPLIEETIPNEELAAGARKIHQRLVQVESDLRGRLFGRYGGYQQVTDKLKNTMNVANDLLNGNAKARKATSAEIKKTMQELDTVTKELADLYAVAGTKTAAERDGFDEAHKALYSLQRRLRSAVERGDTDRYATTMELKKIYAKVYPKAKTIPDNPEVLYERIAQRQGVADARELRNIQQRLVAVRQQLDELPTSAEADAFRQALVDEESMLTQQIDGFETLADVRMAADYAPDGFVYGTVDNLAKVDPTDNFPYKVLYGHRQERVLADPEAVAIHAPAAKDVIDLRDPETFRRVFNDPNMLDVVGERMKYEGLNGDTFTAEWAHYRDTGEIDPTFETMYEPEAQLIKQLDALGMALPEGDVFHADEINAILDNIHNLYEVIGRNAGDADIGNRLFNDTINGIMNFNDGRPILVPADFLGDAVPNGEDAWALITPSDWSKPLPKKGGMFSPMDEVHSVQDSPIVQRILAGDYESASLDTVVQRDNLIEGVMNSEADIMARDALEQEANKLSRQAGGTKAAATKRLRQAEENLAQWEKTKTVDVVIDGKRTKLNSEKARKLLASKDAEVARAELKLEKAITKIQRDLGIPNLLKKQATLEERLPTLFNQAEVLQRWNETTGELLRNETDNLNTLLKQRPTKDAAAVYTRTWQNKVKRAMDSIKMLPPAEAKAYERLVTQLHADESRLAWLQMMEIPHADSLAKLYESGDLAGHIIKTTEDGWTALAGLGVQMPDEIAKIWKPNLEEMLKKSNKNVLIKTYDNYTRFFKTYATASVGFSVRNAMSAVFMNTVAGVSSQSMFDGLRASRAIGKDAANWMTNLGLSEGEKQVYEMAWRMTEVTGKGFGDELAEPVMGGSVFEKVINNKFTKTMHRMNDFVERSVRFPMALDSVRRGHTFDEGVKRIAKYHFDYSDMSALDETMKKFVPFWIWTSRNIPLQITSMITRPGAYAAYNRIQEQYPPSVDLFMPNWLEKTNPIGLGGKMVLAPDLPFGRLEESAGNIMTPSGLIGQMNPLLKLPLEVGVADKNIALDIPFSSNYDKARGVDKAVAWLGQVIGAEGIGKTVVDENGQKQLVINPKVSYALNNLLPPLAKAERLSGGRIGGKSNYSKRLKTAWLNEFGVPLKNVEVYERGEAVNRQFALAEFAKQLEEQGKISKQTRNK